MAQLVSDVERHQEYLSAQQIQLNEKLTANEDFHSQVSINIAKLEDDLTGKLKSLETSVLIEAASKAAEAVCSHVDETKPINALIIGLIKDEYSSGF